MNYILGVTNVTDDKLWVRPLSLYFHGNLGVYFEKVKEWKKSNKNPFELEKETFEERIEGFNDPVDD